MRSSIPIQTKAVGPLVSSSQGERDEVPLHRHDPVDRSDAGRSDASDRIEDLEHALDVWRDRFMRADYTDSFAKRQRERDEATREIAAIEARIAALREARDAG